MSANYPDTPLSDGFNSPVGLAAPETLTDDGLWLDSVQAAGHYIGKWRSSNDIGNYYYLGANNTKPAYHTGSDLVLSINGDWYADAHSPIFAPTDAIVTYAQRWPPPAWGNIIVLRTRVGNQYVWMRLAHVEDMQVKRGDVVKRGQIIAKVGNAFGLFAYHLHFDISLSGCQIGRASCRERV